MEKAACPSAHKAYECALRLRAVVALDVRAAALGGVVSDLGAVIRIERNPGVLRIFNREIFVRGRSGDEQQQLGFFGQAGGREAGMGSQPTYGQQERSGRRVSHRGRFDKAQP